MFRLARPFLFFIFLLGGVFLVNGVIYGETVSGYAWSENAGWINFGASSSVALTSSDLTGSVWNENTGWINLNPTGYGVRNDGAGNLSGYAWGEGLGWIDFSGVVINSSGNFTGTANGSKTGQINFSCLNCTVSTAWRPGTTENGTITPVSGSGSYSPTLTYSVLINNGSLYTNKTAVLLKLQTSASKILKTEVSNNSDFSDATQVDYKSEIFWNLTSGDGQKTVYVRFYYQNDQSPEVRQGSIILDTTTPDVKILGLKTKYFTNENVIISGTAENSANIIVLIDDSKYGFFDATNSGNWAANFGQMSAGSHKLEFYSYDLARNRSNSVSASFIVESTGTTSSTAPPNSPSPNIFNWIGQKVGPLFSGIFKKEEVVPVPVVTVPKIAPISLSSKWTIVPMKPLSRFVLSPLPGDIALLAQKFPQVEKTFTEVGIKKVTDLHKLQTTNLSLPGLTKTIDLPQPIIKSQKFSLVKGVPVANLSATAKSKIPSNIVFAKAAGGLVDFNIALSINDKGDAQQSIRSVVGENIQLVVRADKPVNRVVGYLLFKSRDLNAGTNDVSYKLPLNSMASSLVFANPSFSNNVSVSASNLINIEGTANLTNFLGENNIATNDDKNSTQKQGLVLDEFEYVDTGNGVYTADVPSPAVDGQYEIITIMDYKDPTLKPKEMRLTTVVDPEGYVYEKSGDMETRISGAIITLYWLNPETKQYELWPAKEFQQENPQVTSARGVYSFLVPDGFYYLKVDAPGYFSYDGKPFEVKEGSGVHINVEMKDRFWILSIFDWKTVLLIVVIILLMFNFYRDRKKNIHK